MEDLLKKFEEKLYNQDLVEKNNVLFGFYDDEIVWNKSHKLCDELNNIFYRLNINSLLFAEPKEPFKSIINYLTENNDKVIFPNDTETKTFLHDLPFIRNIDTKKIIEILKKRKSVIIKDKGIVSFGTVSPEQAFVVFSSVCFACFVKYFSDYYIKLKNNQLSNNDKKLFKKIINLKAFSKFIYNDDFLVDSKIYKVPKEPFEVYDIMDKVGKLIIDIKLVDSYFGNISYLFDDKLYISQTTSSLDELNGYIDACPLDGSKCTSITASSEYSAHIKIIEESGYNAVLHGHPKFSVILSMFCEKNDCKEIGNCHKKCKEDRNLNDIPIVTGEVGRGPYGLCNTVPYKITDKRGVIVYGHGVFSVGKNSFDEAFMNLYNIEKMCQKVFFEETL